jgi:hypothetical protein
MSKVTDDFDDVPNGRQVEFEERIHKLETALAEKSAGITEDSVADRVIAKLITAGAVPEVPNGTERVLVLASSPDRIPPPPKGAVLHPLEAMADREGRTWFFTQLLLEFRLSLHMYFDPRYRISRTTQFALPGIALLMLFNYFFFTLWLPIAFVSPIAERLVDVILCVIAYKLLIRELGRYRDVLDYLAQYGHR